MPDRLDPRAVGLMVLLAEPISPSQLPGALLVGGGIVVPNTRAVPHPAFTLLRERKA